MKPSELKSPFDWANRHVLIHDRIWYVPKLCKQADEYTFPGWHHEQTFTTNQPICVEYCSGNGTWIAAKAREHTHQNWVAVELKFERVRKIWSKIKNEDLSNLLAVCGEGYEITKRYFINESVESVFINFPDPWPKTKHAKHRIVQPRFVKEIHRILKPGGVLTMVTDDEAYSKIMIAELLAAENFESIYPDPYFVHDHPGYGQSYFGDLWREKGKNIHYHAFRKI
jgi:tRNA (guanine-N7-)-methyltransferase